MYNDPWVGTLMIERCQKKTIVLAFPFNQSLQIIGFASSVEDLTHGYGKIYQLRFLAHRTVDRFFMISQKSQESANVPLNFSSSKIINFQSFPAMQRG